MPWASSSRLGGEVRCCGSSLSTASRFSSVSSEATAAIVTAGRVDRRVRPLREVGQLQEPEEPGQAVRHRHLHQMARLDDPRPAELPEQQADPDAQQHHDQRRGDDRLLQRLAPVPDDQQRDRHQADRGRAGVDVARAVRPNSENVFSWSGCWNAMSPSGSGSWPRTCGICFRIRITPMAASRPLITLDGKNAAMNPARASPRPIWISPAITTASRNASNDPKRSDLGGHDRRQAGRRAADAGVRPAQHAHQNAADDAGQHAREQRGIRTPAPLPGTSGRATRNTTRPAVRSRGRVAGDLPFVNNIDAPFLPARVLPHVISGQFIQHDQP